MTNPVLDVVVPRGMRTALAGAVAAGVPVFYNMPHAGGLEYGYVWSITFNNNAGGLVLDVATGLLCILSPLNAVACMLLSAA